MKKILSLVLAAAMTAALLCVPVMADGSDLIKVLMSTDELTLSQPAAGAGITCEDMQAAIDAAMEAEEPIIPEDRTIRADRMTVFQYKNISCQLPEYYVTFKFWSSAEKTVCIFFQPEGSDTWELLTCELGDVVEAHFLGNGAYAITMCW